MASKVLFFFPDQVHLLDIIGPVHIFFEAQEYGADVELHYISLANHTETVSSAGLTFSHLKSFEQYGLDANDYIFVPGLDKNMIYNSEFTLQLSSFYNWLHKQHANGAKICSVCTGAYLLAQAGLLNGIKCTTHWKYIDDFRSKFPNVELLKDRLFVKDKNIYSSAGVSSGIDLSLYIIEELYGSMFAVKVAKEVVVYIRRTKKDPQVSIFLQYRNHIEDRIHQVQNLLAQDLSKALKVEELATLVHMSPRNLTRLFKKTTGITIGQYVDKLRLERALILLSEKMKVESVAQSCGFSGANQLRELLKKQDMLPHREALSSEVD